MHSTTRYILIDVLLPSCQNTEMHNKVTVYVSLLVVWSFREYACFGKYFNVRVLTSNLVFDKENIVVSLMCYMYYTSSYEHAYAYH